jgi:hypothetical protein
LVFTTRPCGPLLEDCLEQFEAAGQVADFDGLEGDACEVADGPRLLSGPGPGVGPDGGGPLLQQVEDLGGGPQRRRVRLGS